MARTGSTKRKTATPASQPASSLDGSSRLFVLVVAGILVVGLAAVAFAVTQRDSDGTTTPTAEQTAAVELSGGAIPPMPQGVNITDVASDPAAGAVAPTLTGTGFDGTEITIGPDGSPKAIYFLAHWCPHCQTEVPVVQQLLDDGRKPSGLDVYAVSTAVDAGRGNYPPQTWLEREGLSVPTVRDDGAGSAMTAFGGGGFPYVVYLDAEHRVVARSSGSLNEATIEQLWQIVGG